MLEDETKYGAAARVAQIDSELVDLQQGIASCLRAQELLVAQDMEIVRQEVNALQVGCCCPPLSALCHACITRENCIPGWTPQYSTDSLLLCALH